MSAPFPSRLGAVLLALVLALASACASRRVLTVENRLLLQENEELHETIRTLELQTPAPGSYVRHPDLEDIHHYLDRAGRSHTWSPGASHIRVTAAGVNTEVTVNIQHFESAGLLFLSTDDYLHLDKATSTESLVLLLVQLSALNYELLLGKFQANPETGEIMLSVELITRDGLGYETFTGALDQLLRTADSRFPELERAAAGQGL